MVSGRRLVTALAASAGLVAVSVVTAPRVVHATPGPSGGACTLSGHATLSPGLTTSSVQFSYSFTGTLTNCQASDSTAPTSGTVQAGGTVTIGGVTYTLPSATGTGGCTNSTTSGTSLIIWADGSRTVSTYTTNGALAAVALQGTVVAGMNTPQGTITTTRYLGDTALAALVFHPADPTQCNGAGVTDAPIDGEIGVGTVATS